MNTVIPLPTISTNKRHEDGFTLNEYVYVSFLKMKCVSIVQSLYGICVSIKKLLFYFYFEFSFLFKFINLGFGCLWMENRYKSPLQQYLCSASLQGFDFICVMSHVDLFGFFHLRISKYFNRQSIIIMQFLSFQRNTIPSATDGNSDSPDNFIGSILFYLLFKQMKGEDSEQ